MVKVFSPAIVMSFGLFPPTSSNNVELQTHRDNQSFFSCQQKSRTSGCFHKEHKPAKTKAGHPDN
jgi:hypothetical protein